LIFNRKKRARSSRRDNPRWSVSRVLIF